MVLESLFMRARGFTTSRTFTELTGIHTFTVPVTDTANHPFKEWSTGQITRTITVSIAGTYTAVYGSSQNETQGPPILWLIAGGIIGGALVASGLVAHHFLKVRKKKTPQIT